MSFLLATIDTQGYINTVPSPTRCARVIHRETLELCYRPDAKETFAQAKEEWGGGESDQIILALTRAGGVAEIWCSRAQETLVKTRLRRWHSCYGRWPVRLFND